MEMKIIQNQNEYLILQTPNKTVYEAILSVGAAFAAPCGGKGICGKCRVRISPAPPPTQSEADFLSADELAQGVRLACMSKPAEDCTVLLPDTGHAVISTGSITRGFTLNPICGGSYGVAIDIGTTTIAAYLVSFQTGQTIDIYSALNNQKSFGADVISRIQYVLENADGGQSLQNTIADQLSFIINILLSRNAIPSENMGGLMIVGNTTMLHILCGFDVSGIATAPFIPATIEPLHMSAKALGLKINPNAQVFLPPCVSGYVGADTLSAMIATDMDERSNCLLADIGTNGEIVLAHGGSLYAAATAAGPAFEGGNVSCGMAGVEGAIDKVTLCKSEISFTTIGTLPPKGICGSGLMDLATALIQAGVVDETGRMLDADEIEDAAMASRVQQAADGQNIFFLTKDISLAAKDIRQLQLAKSAIAAGIIVLTHSGGAELSQLDTLYLAGGFGNYLRKQSAVAIGLLPQEMSEKIIPCGNAAGGGAILMLLDKTLYAKAADLAEKCHYIELSNSKDFMDEFVMNMGF